MQLPVSHTPVVWQFLGAIKSPKPADFLALPRLSVSWLTHKTPIQGKMAKFLTQYLTHGTKQ
jgi:hypothetical protein